MYWWQWVLQIIGAWFCLGVAVGVLWIAFVRLGRRSKVERPAALSAISYSRASAPSSGTRRRPTREIKQPA